MDTPGQRARGFVTRAETDFRKGNLESARKNLEKSFSLKSEAEIYAGDLWRGNHQGFITAMLDMSVLWYKLGELAEGDRLASHAQAWADDPNCSSQRNFERSFRIRNGKFWYFLSGLGGRFRSLVPA